MKQPKRKKSLTEGMLLYQANGNNYQELHDQTAVYVYNFLRRCRYLGEDLKSDFFLSLYPSFETIIRNFRYSGIPFEQYIVYIAKKRMKSFLKKAHKSAFLWTMFQTPGFEIQHAQRTSSIDEGADSNFREILKINEAGKITNPTARKRFLCFAFQQVRYHSEEEIHLIADIADMPHTWVQSKVEALRQKLSRQEGRLNELTRRRNRLFIGIRSIEYKINHEYDRDKKRELFSQLAKKKATLEFVMDAIRHIPLMPTHQEIGNVLDIPKGTVDIQMFRLKQRIQKALKSAQAV